MLRRIDSFEAPDIMGLMHAAFAHIPNRALINRREKIAMRFPIDAVLIARQEPEFWLDPASVSLCADHRRTLMIPTRSTQDENNEQRRRQQGSSRSVVHRFLGREGRS